MVKFPATKYGSALDPAKKLKPPGPKPPITACKLKLFTGIPPICPRYGKPEKL
jgi:hypothetical protein